MNNLKTLLKTKGVSVDHISLDTGYSRAAFYKWMRGETTPNLYAARDVAQHLGVTDKDIWV